ncbi:acyltransferase [Sinorhizobium meliloti]|uniref:acyltransferase n=1 Tax=Rhizobium meliloti TaxID=382 RepID=UPI000FD60151|nr:acyltransferase [Sinorhizobium meliloti]MDX0253827.1 acyltransferase [Sinorhizobium meliloti]MDX0285556.1 acyltransferase [Sinorhizobium meliloti]RVI05273.1 acyltransferase [Sinorhizobium meliloti]RVK09455.1 acyltransferase [Sinorhizobium meliloti]RVL50562.1 acyltransferase [Sinorhizobium meliloti]
MFEIFAKNKELIQVSGQKVIDNSSITVKGENSSVVIAGGGMYRGAKILIESDNSSVLIEEGVIFTGSIFLKGKGRNSVRIGRGSTFGNATIICSEGSSFSCGFDCMFAWAIEVRTTDSHGIFDLATGERVNAPENISIGNHVWVAAKATLAKGTTIGDGCVVGMNSFCNRDYGVENSIIVGNPARVARSGIRWERPLLG